MCLTNLLKVKFNYIKVSTSSDISSKQGAMILSDFIFLTILCILITYNYYVMWGEGGIIMLMKKIMFSSFNFSLELI